MTPYNLTLEQWLLKTNPGLTIHELYRHEELVGKAIQMSLEIEAGVRTAPNPATKKRTEEKEPQSSIDDLIEQANAIIPAKSLNDVVKFWTKQKQYIAMQHDLQQMDFLRKRTVPIAASFFWAYFWMQLTILKRQCSHLWKITFRR